MVHDGRAAEAHRALVAISTWRRGNDVIGRLSNGEGPVVTAGAVSAVGRDVPGERGRAECPLRSFASERAVVTRIASAGADRRVTRHAHGIGHETGRGIGMAVAALNPGYRHVRWRGHAGRGGAIVAT